MKQITSLSILRILLSLVVAIYSLPILSQTSDVVIEIDWRQLAGENRFTISDPSGNILIDYCMPLNCANDNNISHRNIILPLGSLPNDVNYRLDMFDRYGDGWDHDLSRIIITSDGVEVVNTTLSSGTLGFELFNLSGVGVRFQTTTEIDLFFNGYPIEHNHITLEIINNVPLGTAPVNVDLDRNFEIRNVGSAPLNLIGTSRVRITGANAANFLIVTQPSASVAAGTSSFFTVRFNRTTVGTSSAAITILSNDENQGTYNFNISATTIPIVVPTSQSVTLLYENFDSGANDGSFESHLDGEITTVFSFSERQNDAAQQRFHSYLAIKNGVSLQQPGSTLDYHRADWDYLDSANNIIWNAAANNAFNYDLAVIGRDDASQLVQQESKSRNTYSIIAIGLSRVENMSALNAPFFFK
jgi:hypothetical protein